MFKNTASQSVTLSAFDASTGLQKTGDAANMVFYVSKDDGAVTAIASNSGVPTESDATNAKGDYKIALSQTETNADKLRFTGKSSTSNIVVVAQTIYTVPANFTTQSIDGSGRVDVIKIAGTTQTARDIGASVLLSVGTGTGQVNLTSGKVPATLASTDVTGNVASDLQTIKTQTVTCAGGVTIPAATLASTTNITSASGVSLISAYDPAKTASQAGDAMTLTAVYDFAKGTVAMTESYAAQHATMTPVQALYQINQHLGESGIVTTTKTLKKRDGSTTAKTFTLDSATTPTSVTEAT